ncbi:MAG TPA: sigma-70 family RNA polymerase sigma factor [Gaiellaceae bacterium]|nr:sigma-70 family RNA polymerase sigma factor [Gaiellaceae bacterium]
MSDDRDDLELVRRIGEGDTNALRTLYERYGSILFGYSLRLLGDRQAAEECTQDVLLSVWRGARGYDPERAAVSSWMIAIARNRAIDAVRRRAARPADPYAEVPEGSEAPDTAERVAADDTAARVAEALAELPEGQRDVVLLAYFQGLSHSEIAEQLRLPLGTVKGRMRLALDRLRTLAPRYALDVERGA